MLYYAGKSVFQIAVHECRKLLLHDLHIMTYMYVCYKYANLVLKSCLRSCTAIRKTFFSQFWCTNMATATRSRSVQNVTEMYGSASGRHVGAPKCIAVIERKVFFISLRMNAGSEVCIFATYTHVSRNTQAIYVKVGHHIL